MQWVWRVSALETAIAQARDLSREIAKREARLVLKLDALLQVYREEAAELAKLREKEEAITKVAYDEYSRACGSRPMNADLDRVERMLGAIERERHVQKTLLRSSEIVQ